MLRKRGRKKTNKIIYGFYKGHLDSNKPLVRHPSDFFLFKRNIFTLKCNERCTKNSEAITTLVPLFYACIAVYLQCLEIFL